MRSALRRVVFLLAGGAVSVAVLILATPLSAPLPGSQTLTALLLLPIWLALSAALGLLPGVRELAVAGARDLLGVVDDAVVTPEPMRWGHRWRTALWVLGHQVTGLLAGIAITTGALLLVTLVLLAAGREDLSAGELTIDLPSGPARAGLALGCVAGIGLVVLTALLAGRAAAWAAPLLLGPTGADRLMIAEARLARGRAHLRLSQDLHDGVGHSLSAISLQAVAAERGLGPDEGRAREALLTIRGLAAGAVDELEQVLSVLRDDADGRARLEEHRDARDLPGLVEAHRDRGMTVELTRPDPVPDLPSVVGRTAHRVVAEGLANAEKHATDRPVQVAVADAGREVVVMIRNPAPGTPRESPFGHGLASLREQVELVGGTLHAGPRDPEWVLEVRLPTGVHRGR